MKVPFFFQDGRGDQFILLTRYNALHVIRKKGNQKDLIKVNSLISRITYQLPIIYSILLRG